MCVCARGKNRARLHTHIICNFAVNSSVVPCCGANVCCATVRVCLCGGGAARIITARGGTLISRGRKSSRAQYIIYTHTHATPYDERRRATNGCVRAIARARVSFVQCCIMLRVLVMWRTRARAHHTHTHPRSRHRRAIREAHASLRGPHIIWCLRTFARVYIYYTCAGRAHARLYLYVDYD